MRAAVVEADAHGTGFHVAAADDKHRVDAQLFRVGNLRFERYGALKSALARDIFARNASRLAMTDSWKLKPT